MKPTKFTNGRLLLALLISGLTIGLVSWDHEQAPGRFQQEVNDTVPKTKPGGHEKKIRDLDDVLDELNNVDMKVNMEKLRNEIEEAMKKIDGDKIKAEITEAMKELDMAKIQLEVQESLAKVDWDKVKTELNRVKDIDMKQVEKEMEKVKEEIKNLRPKIEKEMVKVKVEIEKAKVEIKEYKEFVNGLDNDGLINKKEGYSLKHKDGELFINGKKASEQTYSKYRSFLEKHKKFNIKKDDDDFDIDMD